MKTTRKSSPPVQLKYKICIKFLSARAKTGTSLTDWAPHRGNGFDDSTIDKWLCGRHTKGDPFVPPICADWRKHSPMVLRKIVGELRAKLKAMPPLRVAGPPNPIPQLVAPTPTESLQDAVDTIQDQLDRIKLLIPRRKLLKVK